MHRGGPILQRRLRSHRVAGAGGVWLPTDDPDAVRWWRGDLGRTMVSTKVSAWTDQIEGASVSQGTDANRPTVGSLGGQDALSFGGAAWLRGASFASVAVPYRLILVFQHANTTGSQLVLDDGNGNTNNWFILEGGGTWQAGNGASALTSTTTSDTTARAFLVNHDGATTSQFFVDDWGTAEATGTLGTAPNTDMTVGAGHADTAPYSGTVAEIIITTASVAYCAAQYGPYLTSRYSSITVTS